MESFNTINLKALPLYPPLWVERPLSYTNLLKSYEGIVKKYQY